MRPEAPPLPLILALDAAEAACSGGDRTTLLAGRANDMDIDEASVDAPPALPPFPSPTMMWVSSRFTQLGTFTCSCALSLTYRSNKRRAQSRRHADPGVRR